MEFTCNHGVLDYDLTGGRILLRNGRGERLADAIAALQEVEGVPVDIARGADPVFRDAYYDLVEDGVLRPAGDGWTVVALDEGQAAPVNPKAAKLLSDFAHGSDVYVRSVARPVTLYKRKGEYDVKRAPSLAKFTVEQAAKFMHKQYAEKGSGTKWHDYFGPATREAAAKMLVKRAEKEAKTTKYDELLPKKYRKGFKGYGKDESVIGGVVQQVLESDDSLDALLEWTPYPVVEGARLYAVPVAVQAAARKGLELRRKTGKGGTRVGLATAHLLAKGEKVPHAKVEQVARYFPRHAVDAQADGWGDDENPSPGWVAWLLWGGDAGRKWATKIVREGAQ